MTIRQIVTLPDPVLRRKARPVTRFDSDLQALIEDMIETMHKAPGLGLAAPQVDVSKRLITVDLSVGENPDELLVLINPTVVNQEGQVTEDEACLSIPGVTEKVTRPSRVVVSGLGFDGGGLTIEADDLLARVLCHEIDHLDGKLFIERLSPLKRALIKKKLKKTLEPSADG